MLNSLSFVFKFSFLPKYRVIYYYDYIVKWCSGMQFNWRVSLDIAQILALSYTSGQTEMHYPLTPLEERG